jgi:DNA (cytosine-5)-methyltransferase 1
MWPTPSQRDYKGQNSMKHIQEKPRHNSQLPNRLKQQGFIGQLNPTWVEWLMGYPSGWTDLNPSETVSSLKSPTTSDQSSLKRWPTTTSTDGQRGDVKNLDGYRRRRDKWAAKGVNIHKPLDVAVALEEEKKMWRTPTAIDGGDKAEKYAARILLGKNKRSSKHKVQETLSMQVAMEELKDDPQRVEELMKEEMVTRPQLPEQKEFVEYMHSQTTPRKLSDQSGIDYTTVEHWFRRGKYFSHPSIKDWNHIKQFLQEVKFDKEMTTTETIEWKN